MVINKNKTKAMLFNPCKSKDFMPDVRIGSQLIEVTEEIRLLGVTVSSDLKWSSNTENLVKKASKRLWLIRRLKNMGASQWDLVDMYTKQIRSVLELAVPAWQGALTLEEKLDIERIQKSAAHIIMGQKYHSYDFALKYLNLESLESRRVKLCLNFAQKALKHDKFQSWFKLSDRKQCTRKDKPKFCEVYAKHSRLYKSPIAFLTRLLNEHSKQ